MLAAFIVTLAIVLAQPAPRDAFLERLAGDWTGKGTVLQSPAEVQLTWAWTLDGQFIRLTFANAMGKRQFEGHAYYRALGGGRYRGWWFDNSGTMRPIEAALNGDALVASWGTPETELGETTYRLTTTGSMEILDRVRGKDGQWRDFGKVTASRR